MARRNYRQESIEYIMATTGMTYHESAQKYESIYRKLIRREMPLNDRQARTINASRELYYNITSDKFNNFHIDIESKTITAMSELDIYNKSFDAMRDEILESDLAQDVKDKMIIDLNRVIERYVAGDISKKQFNEKITEYKESVYYQSIAKEVKK